MNRSLFQFIHLGQAPSLTDVKRRFQMDDAEIDESFGVICTDPIGHYYVVSADPAACERAEALLLKEKSDGAPVQAGEGRFGDVRVEGF